MFQRAIILLVIFLAIVLQISVFPNIFPSGLTPEIILIMIIFWTTQDGFEKTWPKSIIAGFILDLSYSWPIGFDIISLAAVSYGTGYLTKRFLVSQKNLGFVIALLLVAAGTYANNLILLLLFKIYNDLDANHISNLALSAWDRRIFLRIAINLAMFIIIYWPLARLNKFLSFYGKNSMQGRFFK